MTGKTYIDLSPPERFCLGWLLFDAHINSPKNDHLADFGWKLRRSLLLRNARRTTSTPINKAEAYVLGKTVLALWEYWPADRFHKRNLLSASLKLIHVGSVRPGKRAAVDDAVFLDALEAAQSKSSNSILTGPVKGESPLEYVVRSIGRGKDIRTIQRAIKRAKAMRTAIAPATRLLLNISE